MIELYTDGSCMKNPGPGGWAAVIFENGKEFCLTGFDPATTNNRMELMGVIRGLEAIDRGRVVVFSDSKYVVDGANKWVNGWKNKGWKQGERMRKNYDLWQMLLDAKARHELVIFQWVKGHNGNVLNERADALANISARGNII